MILKNIDILRMEFIGKQVNIPSRKIVGKIIDETKNSFLIKTEHSRKRVPKINSLFQININNGLVEVDGNLIAMRPEDRIKIKK